MLISSDSLLNLFRHIEQREPRVGPHLCWLTTTFPQELWEKFFMLIWSLCLKYSKHFFQRLNHMTLIINKCQAFYVKAQYILLRKVADNLIFHTNKLRHEGDKSETCCGSSILICAVLVSVSRPVFHESADSVSRIPRDMAVVYQRRQPTTLLM